MGALLATAAGLEGTGHTGLVAGRQFKARRENIQSVNQRRIGESRGPVFCLAIHLSCLRDPRS